MVIQCQVNMLLENVVLYLFLVISLFLNVKTMVFNNIHDACNVIFMYYS